MLEALLLAVGLAMDATAVSAARGARAPSLLVRDAWLLPLLFGAFQAGMAALGWLGASWTARYLASWDYWLAFAVLVLIGGKMLRDGLRADDPEGDTPEGEPRPSRGSFAGALAVDLSLALATSLDAAAAGVSLPSIPVAPAVTLAWIGAATAALSLLGFVVGARAGSRFGRAATALGGVVLIGIGARILWRALAA
ncbi:MAG: manganese efflux pump MntP family protein [Kofleriaceae bacterium]